MLASLITPETASMSPARARPGALSPAQMEQILARAPTYRISPESPAVVHAGAAQHLWGGRLIPMMAASEMKGRFAGAALTCPPTACTGTLSMVDGARSKAWRNPDAIENVICLEGRLELRYGARLEHTLVLERFDLASVPAGVRHAISNDGDGDGEARALVALSVAPGGTYEAIFDAVDGDALPAAHAALGVRFDHDQGLEVDVESVASRVARFSTLVPYKKDRGPGLSAEAMEALSAGSVYTLIFPDGHIGRSTAPIYGNQGFYMSIGECRSGDDGPPPHSHQDTQESFFVLDGRWEIYTGFDNESSVTVGPGDVIAMPKQVMRTFRNTSGKTARLLAIIQGPDRMQDAVSFSRRLGNEFERRFGAEAVEAYKQKGMTFDAEDRLGL